MTEGSALSAFLARTVPYEKLPTRLPRPLLLRGAAGAMAMTAIGAAAPALGDVARRAAASDFLMIGHAHVAGGIAALELVTGSPLVGLGLAALLLYGWAAVLPTPGYVHVLPVATVSIALVAAAAWTLLLVLFALQLLAWAALAAAAVYACLRIARMIRR